MDYTFEEWSALAYDAKRQIWHHYWNPYEPEIGASTRKAIEKAFAVAHPDLASQALDISCGYFDKEGWVLCVVVKDKKIRVPAEFANLRIAKGVASGAQSKVTWVRT